MVTFNTDQWLRIGQEIFKAAGATESNARRVTESLVDSNLAGHDSHGVQRIPQYVDAIESKHLDPAADPVVVNDTASYSLVDGMWTFGQVSAALCMRKAIAGAKEQGIAASALIRAYHIGRLGEYSEMAQEAGMIGMIVAGGFGGVGGSTTTGVAPFGGAGLAFGTNPISFGIPGGEQPGVMVDFATSAVAGGKISLARAKGTQLPPGCIVDKDGNPTTDPNDFYNGGLLVTFGGHKGYGLATVIELLGQAMTGADKFGDEVGGGGTYTKSGSLFIAMNPGMFRPVDEFKATTDTTLARIKNVRPAPGFSEVLLPGEPERRSKAQRRQEGIPLPDSTWQTVLKIGDKYGVNIPALTE